MALKNNNNNNKLVLPQDLLINEIRWLLSYCICLLSLKGNMGFWLMVLDREANGGKYARSTNMWQ